MVFIWTEMSLTVEACNSIIYWKVLLGRKGDFWRDYCGRKGGPSIHFTARHRFNRLNSNMYLSRPAYFSWCFKNTFLKWKIVPSIRIDFCYLCHGVFVID